MVHPSPALWCHVFRLASTSSPATPNFFQPIKLYICSVYKATRGREIEPGEKQKEENKRRHGSRVNLPGEVKGWLQRLSSRERPDWREIRLKKIASEVSQQAAE